MDGAIPSLLHTALWRGAQLCTDATGIRPAKLDRLHSNRIKNHVNETSTGSRLIPDVLLQHQHYLTRHRVKDVSMVTPHTTPAKAVHCKLICLACSVAYLWLASDTPAGLHQ
jgi:hypothetical protein